MTEIVINKCYGGFGLSHDAIMRYGELTSLNLLFVDDDNSFRHAYYINGIVDEDNYFSDHEIQRDHPALVQTVRELGQAANGQFADLRIVEIPNDVLWYIQEYDGQETVNEQHRSWG